MSDSAEEMVMLEDEQQLELAGMPERPGPLWSDPLLAREIRAIKLRFSGGLELVSTTAGHHVLAECLEVGEAVCLQIEGRVKSRGYDGAQGVAVLDVEAAVRADEAGVLALQDSLEGLQGQHRTLAANALAVLTGLARYLPLPPGAAVASREAASVRELLRDVDVLRMRAHAALVCGAEPLLRSERIAAQRAAEEAWFAQAIEEVRPQ